mgnify:FL=1
MRKNLQYKVLAAVMVTVSPLTAVILMLFMVMLQTVTALTATLSTSAAMLK